MEGAPEVEAVLASFPSLRFGKYKLAAPLSVVYFVLTSSIGDRVNKAIVPFSQASGDVGVCGTISRFPEVWSTRDRVLSCLSWVFGGRFAVV